MLDQRARALYASAIGRVAASAAGAGVSAGAVAAVGVGACVAAALGVWSLALTLWLANRVLDGLDGAIARRTRPSALGGMLDFLDDFVVYAGFVVAVAVAMVMITLGQRVALAVRTLADPGARARAGRLDELSRSHQLRHPKAYARMSASSDSCVV